MPRHVHPCARCERPHPCPMRHPPEAWCLALVFSGLHICLGCKIAGWLAEGVAEVTT